MSHLLGRIAKLSSSSSVGKKQRLGLSKFRPFSTAAAAKPYLLFSDTNHMRKSTGEKVVDLNLYDPRKDERVKIPYQTLSKNLCSSVRFGTSRGWVGVNKLREPRVYLTNIYNPCASVSSHKVISLPPLVDPSYEARQLCDLSLSASPDEEKCGVATRSTSSFVSLCRPGDSEWTHIDTPVFAFEIIYSDRDQCFYLHRPVWGEDPVDPVTINTSSDFPPVKVFQRFPLSDIPKSLQDQATFKIVHLVESPYGDSSIVYACNELLLSIEELKSRESSIKPSKRPMKPRTFVVYRQDPEQKMSCYTRDIGHLCFFLGHNETFCVSATEYPGLNPNSIYFADKDTGFGYYDLSPNTLHEVVDPPPFSTSYMWLAPLQ